MARLNTVASLVLHALSGIVYGWYVGALAQSMDTTQSCAMVIGLGLVLPVCFLALVKQIITD